MCLRPISIKSVDSFGLPCNQTVPCGKCVECLKDKQNSWKIRLTEEARDHKYIYFFTLTYCDDAVPFIIHPVTGERVLHNCKQHVQDWTKRNRIYFERLFHRSVDFKYFICSEYGPNTGRPHYHGILFCDIIPSYISRMFNDWSVRYGFTNYSLVGSPLNSKRKSKISSVGNYVAKYCIKPPQLCTEAEKRIAQYVEQGIIPGTWYIMSKGIGQFYINRMRRYHLPFIKSPSDRVSTIVDRAWYYEGAFKYKLPRYFRDRLYRVKYPFDSRVWNKKTKCYEQKIVYRYASKNMLARQMQIEIRNRLLADYNERVAEISALQNVSRVEADILLSRIDSRTRLARQEDIFGKLARFYNYNRFKNKSF